MANLIYDAALSFGKRPTITTGTFPDVLNLGRTRAEDYYPGKEGTNADRDDLLELYGAGGAVVYDEREFRVYPVSEPDALPPAADGEHPRYIGYPYRGVFRSMPVLANNQMKKQRITTLIFRFLDSFLPLVSSIAGGRVIQTDTITNLRVPFSGVHSIPFPGTWDDDVQVELVSEGPEPVTILALNAQAQRFGYEGVGMPVAKIITYDTMWKIPFPGIWDEDVQAELVVERPEPVTVLALSAEVP